MAFTRSCRRRSMKVFRSRYQPGLTMTRGYAKPVSGAARCQRLQAERHVEALMPWWTLKALANVHGSG